MEEKHRLIKSESRLQVSEIEWEERETIDDLS